MQYQLTVLHGERGKARGVRPPIPKDPEARRKEKAARALEHMREWRIRTLMFFGGKCERCGNNDSRVLQLDHINGGGHKERRTVGPRWTYRGPGGAMTRPDEFQLLCANCNWIKRCEQHEEGGHASLFVGGA